MYIVIRYTKEEIMTLRKPMKMLRSMTDMLEVASIERLNPVCFEKFEPDDVSALIVYYYVLNINVNRHILKICFPFVLIFKFKFIYCIYCVFITIYIIYR